MKLTKSERMELQRQATREPAVPTRHAARG